MIIHTSNEYCNYLIDSDENTMSIYRFNASSDHVDKFVYDDINHVSFVEEFFNFIYLDFQELQHEYNCTIVGLENAEFWEVSDYENSLKIYRILASILHCKDLI